MSGKIVHIISVILFGLSFMADAQNKYNLIIKDEEEGVFTDSAIYRTFRKEVVTHRDLDRFMYLFYENGYLLANYEPVNTDSNFVSIIVRPGKQFKWVSLNKGNIPDEILNKTGYRPSLFSYKIVNFNRITELFDKIIEYSRNNGYPFSTVNLNQIRISENFLSASINYDSGPLMVFGDLKLLKNNRIKLSFLESYLQIIPGKIYDQRKINKIPDLINRLEFLELDDPPRLDFTEGKCLVELNLNDTRSNRFDGIIGFLPNENEKNKWLITGELFLKLNNFFKTGKSLVFDWKKPNLLSQQLEVQYSHPAIFRLPIDFLMDFELFKQDSSFINRTFSVDVLSKQIRTGNIGLGYEYMSSRLLSSRRISSAEDLSNIDFTLNSYGLTYYLYTLNEPVFPSNGFEISLKAQIGNKEIIRNSAIDETLYQDLEDNSLQWRLQMRTNKFSAINPKNIILTRIMAGYVDNQQLFMNDLFRLGGLNTLRGFNENHFYASWYLAATLEYRYQFENESQIIVFTDFGGLGYDINETYYRDFPVGAGTGFRLATGAGILNIFYALGKSNDQPFGINYSRIHIGYMNRF